MNRERPLPLIVTDRRLRPHLERMNTDALRLARAQITRSLRRKVTQRVAFMHGDWWFTPRSGVLYMVDTVLAERGSGA